MSGFPVALSAGQKTTLRTSDYWQRSFIAFNSGEVVFQCRANEAISIPFKAFAWDTTLQGSYSDVWQNMVVFISDTTDYLKDYKYRGYVRLSPSATEFRIDLNATVLNDGDYITVLRDTDLNARVRQGDLVAGSVAWHNLPPVTTGLPSVVVLVDSDNDSSVAWTPAQTGVATAQGATISTYAWAVSGSGAYTISSASAQNPDFTFTPGYHYLVRLITTDSNGVANFILVHIYAITRTFAAPVILPAAAGSISQDLEGGYSGSISAYGGVSNLPYRTHAVVFCVEHFGDASSTPIVTNVLMHGRLRSEAISNEGTEEGGAEQLVTYPIEGITSYLQRLKTPDDIIRTTNSPDEWGEIKQTTPFRMAVYYLFAYTTLLNIASFSAGDSLFDAWQIGGEPTGIDGGNAAAALDSILSRIGAAVNYAPDGELRCEITASLKTDRSALVTIVDLLVSDVTRFELSIDTSRQLAQTTAFGGVWSTTINNFRGYTALAPSIPYGDAPETRESNRELLATDSTAALAAVELKARAGNDFAYNNPKWLFSADMLDSWRWLVCTNYQRYTWAVAATYDLRNIAITTATKWQCQRVNITIGVDGTYGVSAEFVEETTFSDAQSIASQLPNNAPASNPNLPMLSDDPAFPDDPLWMYPTDNPTAGELQPIDPYSGYLSYSPFTADQAAAAAAKQPDPYCQKLSVNLRNSGTVATATTEVGVDYAVTVRGYGWLDSLPGGCYNTDTGYFHLLGGSSGNDGGGRYARSATGIYASFEINFGEEVVLDSGSYIQTKQSQAGVDQNDYDVTLYNGATLVAVVFTYSNPIDGGYDWFTDTIVLGAGSTFTRAVFRKKSSAASSTSYVRGQICITGGATRTRGDAFYSMDVDTSGVEGAAAAYGGTQGLRVDGAAVGSIPAFDGAHQYEFVVAGTGSPVAFGFADTTYGDNENANLSITFCSPIPE